MSEFTIKEVGPDFRIPVSFGLLLPDVLFAVLQDEDTLCLLCDIQNRLVFSFENCSEIYFFQYIN